MGKLSYVIRNQFGAFCSVCQSPLSIEEDDWDECDACGGEGFSGDEDEFFDVDDFEPAPPVRSQEDGEQ